MLIVVSPAKSLDYESPLATRKFTRPTMLERSAELVQIMSGKTPQQIQQLMHISPDLAQLNHERFQDWELPFTRKTARPALLAFNGDVYMGMDASGTFSEDDFAHAQKTLRILSGLYGVLRPLDLMMPYRLEMGTRLANPHGKDLYDFWGDQVTDAVAAAVKASPGAKVLVNLASQEYFGSVRPAKLGRPIVTPAFLDGKGGASPKIVSFFAKRARGAMAGWIIRERITSVDDLRAFDGLGYRYDEARSNDAQITFVRSGSINP